MGVAKLLCLRRLAGVSRSNTADFDGEANDFCKAKGLEVKTLQVTTTPSRPAQFGSTELHFKCVPPRGSAEPLVREPDKVIEIRLRRRLTRALGSETHVSQE